MLLSAKTSRRDIQYFDGTVAFSSTRANNWPNYTTFKQMKYWRRRYIYEIKHKFDVKSLMITNPLISIWLQLNTIDDLSCYSMMFGDVKLDEIKSCNEIDEFIN